MELAWSNVRLVNREREGGGLSFIRCAGCNAVQNIVETPFCPECRRCAICGIELPVSPVECSCGYPNDPEQLAALVRREGIRPSDVEFEKRVDAAGAKLWSIKLIVGTLGTSASMWFFRRFGIGAIIASVLVTMWALEFGFHAWAKWLAGNEVQ